MRLIADNIIFSLQQTGGISVYWYELLKRMVADGLNLTILERPDGMENIFRKRLDFTGCKLVVCDRIPVQLSRYLPVQFRMEPGSIFHSSYYRSSSQMDVVKIVTVHDFTYEYFRSGGPRYIHHLQKRHAINHADGIICVSESTRNDLLTFFPEIDCAKIKVIFQAASEEYFPLMNETNKKYVASPRKGEKYALYVGDRSPYKNFDLVVDALEHFAECDLVVVGQPFSRREAENLNRKLAGRHHLLTDVDAEFLNALYNDAFCLVYPSSYEGFGIPIVEAMRAGCPVITTDRSSIPEVCGSAALMVDDLSPEALRHALRSLEDEKIRTALVTRGFEQAKKFSWAKTYRETVAFYRQVHENKFGSDT